MTNQLISQQETLYRLASVLYRRKEYLRSFLASARILSLQYNGSPWQSIPSACRDILLAAHLVKHEQIDGISPDLSRQALHVVEQILY